MNGVLAVRRDLSRQNNNLRGQPSVHKALNPTSSAAFTYSERARGKRARAQENEQLPFAPPERWYEPHERGGPYRTVVVPPSEGFKHVVTIAEVRARLAQLPSDFLRPLEVVHLAQMTRKKRSSPCYGMQWGATIYLYPIEDDLVEHYTRPPRPSQLVEARMYGGKWAQESADSWTLTWTEETIRDFYLNNILIHELGHLLDLRNSRTIDRERYAEWFAIQYGYRPTRQQRAAAHQAAAEREQAAG